jgi:hypothetical protein
MVRGAAGIKPGVVHIRAFMAGILQPPPIGSNVVELHR